MSGSEDEAAPVLAAFDQGVLTLTLNRPAAMNASTGAMSEAFVELVTRGAEDPDVRVIVITGAGRSFCAGADRKVLAEHRATGGHAASGSRGGLPYAGLLTLEKPVIAAVNGPCVGIGVAIAACSDIRIAAPGAYFMLPFARLGLAAEAGLAWLLPRLIGVGHATDLLLTGRRLDAEEALGIGLVQHVIPAHAFHDEVHRRAVEMAQTVSPLSVALMKRQLADAAQSRFADAVALAAQMTKACLDAEDFRAATAQPARPFPGRSASFDKARLAFDPWTQGDGD